MESSLLTLKKRISKDESKRMLGKYRAPRTGTKLSEFEPNKFLIVDTKPQFPPNLPYEIVVDILARYSCFEYWKLNFLNKQFSQLLKSGDIFKVRRAHKLTKPYVLMFTGGDTCWTMFDKTFENSRKLPQIPSNDYCFLHGDKETISVGTQLIVIGYAIEGIVVWRYELERHKWFKCPSMITPRVVYGSATRGTDAFFAGGFKVDNKNPEVVNLVEKYNADTKTWKSIRGMHKQRMFSSGCFLRGKFYVIGGRDENGNYLTCGESYDEGNDSWTLIPDILKDVTFKDPQSPPLIAVVNDNLYSLEIHSNELRVYNVTANTWKKLGIAPVKANVSKGWGVAFKSIGDKLIVIGTSSDKPYNRKMSVYTCRPSPDVEEQIWEETLCCDGVALSNFIQNCCVMFA